MEIRNLYFHIYYKMNLDYLPSPLELGASVQEMKERLNIFLSTHPIPQSVIQALHNM